SWSISAHILSPLSKGLFKRAIMQSGALMFNRDRPVFSTVEGLQKAKDLAKKLNCDEYDYKWLDCLRAIDVELMAGVTGDEGWLLSMGIIPEMRTQISVELFLRAVSAIRTQFHNIDPNEVSDHYIKSINTTNVSQLKGALSQLYGHLLVTCPTYHFAKQFAKSKPGLVDRCRDTTCHGADLPFVFGLPLRDQQMFTETDYDFSIDVMKMWTNFAKYGCVCDETNSVVVNTSSGGVRGQTLNVVNHKINQFLNIPYAEPPVGPLRFSSPQPLKTPKQAVIDGTVKGNSCIQPKVEGLKDFLGELTTSEDCLVLNIWTPNVNTNDTNESKSQLKAVMFWIYAGGWTVGSIFQDIYNGSVLATNDVVIVSVNYRLGPLGFLYGGDHTSPGNLGLYDQLLGLKWVRENIHKFGGDRDQITIFGESAGSWSVSAHILSPLSKGLFKRAIMQSGSVLYNKDRPALSTVEGLQKAKDLAKRLNCDKYDYKWLDCLRAIEDPNLFIEFPKYGNMIEFTHAVFGTQFLPVLPQKAFKPNLDVDLMVGATKDEGPVLAVSCVPEMRAHLTVESFKRAVNRLSDEYRNIDVEEVSDYYLKSIDTTNESQLKRALSALYGDLVITCPTYHFAKQFAKSCIGDTICDAAELPFVFGLPLRYQHMFTETDYDFKMYYMLITLLVWLSITISPIANIDVKTTSGTVRGQTIDVLGKRVNVFTGIPYAEPPVGSLRFAKPKAIEKPLPGIIDATKPKGSCIQGGADDSEDCLFVNVWAPYQPNTSASLLPVMYWVFGGGLGSGSIFYPMYDAKAISTYDVVVVSVNYRLKALGFLYGGPGSEVPGNMGFYDQALGLEWVRDNIHMFGGNKDMVTIFGESAGSWSISALVLSPVAHGLFHRAILESGADLHNQKGGGALNTAKALSETKLLSKHFNCTDEHKWLDCLRALPAKRFLEYEITLAPLDGTEFLPLAAQQAFQQLKYNDVDLIAGVTRNEGSYLAQKFVKYTPEVFAQIVRKMNDYFHELNVEEVVDHYLKDVDKSSSDAIRWRYYDLFGDLLMTCPTYLFARHLAEQSVHRNVYFYELTYQSDGRLGGCDEKTMGICHGSELEFVFGRSVLIGPTAKKLDVDFSREVMTYWTNFAKNGVPTSDTKWPKLSDKGIVKDLNPHDFSKTLNQPFKATCDQFFANYFK
ncbi:unnamed protein product, partial [Oppiella nova]